MSALTPFIGEIYMFAGNFAPVGWAFCNGQLMSIAQNQALFALLGTTYGGDGIQTFALPNLQSRIPIHNSQTHVQGQFDGVESVTLLSSNMPAHTHALQASPAATSIDTPAANTVSGDTTLAGARMYGLPTTPTTMSPSAIGAAGGSQPHENRMPYLAIDFIIALEGIFPSQN